MLKDFIERVKEAWPNYPELYKKVEEQSPFVLEYMNGNDKNFVTFEKVMSAKTLEELKELVKQRQEIAKKREDLRNEWRQAF